MRSERGQGLIEAIAAFPVCVACAMVVVDCGVVVRDRIAVTQAATRAAEAGLAGGNERDAAQGALPRSMQDSVRVQVEADRVVVRAESGARIARIAGVPIVHTSSVEMDR